MDSREVQPSKAHNPTQRTLEGMATEVREEQPRKASIPMEVTLPSVGITDALQPATRVLEAVSMRQFPAEW